MALKSFSKHLVISARFSKTMNQYESDRSLWNKNRFCNRQILEELKKLLSFAARTIEDRKEMIEEFSESLFEIEIHSLCLEFIIQNNTLTFIDWDTENDREVLNRLL